VARVAAARGHRVALYEAAPDIGGHVNLEAAVPHRRELRGIVDYYRRELARLGVEVRLATRATPETVRADRPDVVVVATGSRPALPELSLGALPVAAADEILSGRRFAGRVLVYDDEGRYRGPGAALLLAQHGADVEVVTPELHVGMRLDPSNLVPFYRHLFEARITLTPHHELVGASDGVVRLRNVFTGALVERTPVALVAALLRRVPEDTLYHELRAGWRAAPTGGGGLEALGYVRSEPFEAGSAGLETHLVGDASAARPTDKVILEAAVLGRAL
jgi:NADPH-dependent 2,4-dienoyl-CoA reductase/sulfur reductase-like enzyme